MTRAEMLELAAANSAGDTVLEKALGRYNRASSDVVMHSSILGSAARAASERVLNPNMTPMLDTSEYTNHAVKLAVAERQAWEALFDIAVTLQEAGHEVEW